MQTCLYCPEPVSDVVHVRAARPFDSRFALLGSLCILLRPSRGDSPADLVKAGLEVSRPKIQRGAEDYVGVTPLHGEQRGNAHCARPMECQARRAVAVVARDP